METKSGGKLLVEGVILVDEQLGVSGTTDRKSVV